MTAMPLTPILRRTVAIFRDNPVLFLLPCLIEAALSAFNPKGSPHLSLPMKVVFSIVSFAVDVIGTPLVFAFVAVFTLQSEEGSRVSVKLAWQRIRHQAHLIWTSFCVELATVGACFLLGLAIAIIDLILLPFKTAPAPNPGTLFYFLYYGSAIALVIALALAIIGGVVFRYAIAIPLVLIDRPPKNDTTYSALVKSSVGSRRIFWALTTVIIGSIVPSIALAYSAHFIHLPPSFASAGRWAGQATLYLVGSCFTAFLYITLTLIALNRSTAEPNQEPGLLIDSQQLSNPPVILL